MNDCTGEADLNFEMECFAAGKRELEMEWNGRQDGEGVNPKTAKVKQQNKQKK